MEDRQSSGARILLSPAKADDALTVDISELHRPARWVGWALTLITSANFAVLWWRPRIGMPEWEFSTVGQTLDRMPLLTIGLLLVALGTLQSRSVRATRMVAALFGLLTLAVILMMTLYALSAVVALRAVPPETLSLLKRAIARTVATSFIYMALFGALGVTMWRRTRMHVQGRRSKRQADGLRSRGVARGVEPEPQTTLP